MEDERPWWRQAYGRPGWVQRLDAAPPERLWRFYAGAALVLIAVVVVGLLNGTLYVTVLGGPIGAFGGKAIRGWRLARRSTDRTPPESVVAGAWRRQ